MNLTQHIKRQNERGIIPTVRQLSQHFNLKWHEVEQMVNDSDELVLNASSHTRGFGYRNNGAIGDCTVEYTGV